jgi:phage baseplate assembly protein W
MVFYTIPFCCEDVLLQKRLTKCNLTDSIRQHINLLFKTHFKEHRYDYRYGSIVWDKDYEMIRSIPKWKNDLCEAFEQPLKRYEKRISGIKVTVDVDEIKIVDPQTQEVFDSRKITITITGIMNRTSDPFRHVEHIYFSPLSIT